MTNFTANQINQVPIKKIKPWENNARTHSEHQIQLLAKAIEEFGFTTPVLMKSDGTLVAGHGRVEAAKLVGMKSVPAIWVDHLSDRQIRALVIADNKIATLSGWDYEKLAEEISALAEVDYDLELTGLNEQEIDQMLRENFDIIPEFVNGPVEAPEAQKEKRPLEHVSEGLIEDDLQIQEPQKSVSKIGDVWKLGSHRLMCGDSTNENHVSILMERELAQMVFTDPPYNVKISGLGVAGDENSIGKIHGEFLMASGEMDETEFTDFLKKIFRNLKKFSKSGSIHYVCMDWRHMQEILNASEIYEGPENAGGGVNH